MSAGSGIQGWGFAIPRRRLTNRTVQEAWQRPGMPGARAVTGHDEDSLTLGLQAALQATAGHDRSTLDGLIFASTTGVFAERSDAAVLAAALGLPGEARCLDLGGSLRAGCTALETACELVAAGSCRNVLVIAADQRLARPGSPDEFLFGHAGVALIIGPADGAIARILAHTRHTSSQLDTWRTAGARFPRSGDQRFARQGAYARPTQAVLTGILEQTGWPAADIDVVVPYSPDIKSASRLLQRNGFDLKRQYRDLASPHLGLTGTAHLLVMLNAALEQASPGERLLALGYGDGASACALQMERRPELSHFETALAQGYDISYNRFLALHDLHAGSARDSGGFTSEIMEERNRSLWFSLIARRCGTCDAVITLPLPNCPHCAEPTELADYPLATTGRVFAITHEHYYPTPEPPLGMATVDLQGGGRLTLQVADEDHPLQVGDRVELVFRRLHDAGDRPNYFWKCRAVATGEQDHAG
ncbi:MAG: 3-oxoacyl-[acyl-carrier-protein] synthase III C-terminal domain-containing protein [bacterium]